MTNPFNQHSHKFSHPITVLETDIDELGHVNNVVYLRWVQAVAVAHWRHAAPAYLQEQYRWVILRHEIDYYRPAFQGDNIIGYTWVGKHQGAKFDRFVSLYRVGANQVLAEAKTTWCLLDAKSMRPRRIEEDILAIL